MQTACLNMTELNQLLSHGKFWEILQLLEEYDQTDSFEARLNGVRGVVLAFDEGNKSLHTDKDYPTKNQLSDIFIELLKDFGKSGDQQLRILPIRTKRKNIPLEL